MRNQTVELELKLAFESEVKSYIKLLARSQNGYVNFMGTSSKLAFNLNDILDKYITKSTEKMTSKEVRKTRARAISKYTFEKQLESLIQESL